MHHEDVVKRMTALVYPYVKKALEEDTRTVDIGLVAEAIQNIGLSSSRVMPDELVPNSDEIQDYSTETGRLIIDAWWRFLSFLLDQQPSVLLDVDLLPQGPVSQDYWKAFDSCIVSCPFNKQDLRAVFRQLAQSLGSQENIQIHRVQITREQEHFVARQ